jgi:ABC-type dipeptide/oligopeptide/nickel transport system permease subunit
MKIFKRFVLVVIGFICQVFVMLMALPALIIAMLCGLFYYIITGKDADPLIKRIMTAFLDFPEKVFEL